MYLLSKNESLIVIVCFGSLLSPTLQTPNVQAEVYDYYGIQVSNVCYRMLQYNVTSNCPSYEAIMAVIPDNSNRDRSGDFIIKDNILQRGMPQQQKHLAYYPQTTNKTVIFIDPPNDILSNIKMIFIENKLKDFKLPIQPGTPRPEIRNQTATCDYYNATTNVNSTGLCTAISDNVRYLGDLRYVNNCAEATISAEEWLWLLGDTINYMRNNCNANFTSFNDVKTITTPRYQHDITTSNKWLHETFIDWVKENCLTTYGIC